MFLYKTDITYPLLTDKIYEFKNIDDLKESVKKVMDDWSLYKNDYKKIRDIYYTENAIQKHKKFFDEVFN